MKKGTCMSRFLHTNGTSSPSFHPIKLATRFETKDKKVTMNSFANDFVQAGKDLLDVTFESDLFEFSVEDSSQQEDRIQESTSSWFPDFSILQEDSTPEPMRVQVSVHEQLSAIYDDFSQEGSISVSGTILAKSSSATSFSLAFNDPSKFIQKIEPVESLCEQGAATATDREIRIELQSRHSNDEVLVATYFCDSQLRPVPLLIKSRVSTVKGFVRVGFKIRANPNNEASLSEIVTMIAVPPDVDGSRCKMSRKGGSWDELKRTLTWCVESFAPGEALEIQAQFPLIEENTRVLKFPILVQCKYPYLFSNINVSSKGGNVRLALSMSGQILHRKV